MEKLASSNLKLVLLALGGSLLATPALAHPGHHDMIAPQNVVEHLLSSPFHLALMALSLIGGVALVASYMPRRQKRLRVRLKK